MDSTGDYSQYFIMKKDLKKNVYINHFAAYLKLTQYCKPTIFQ